MSIWPLASESCKVQIPAEYLFATQGLLRVLKKATLPGDVWSRTPFAICFLGGRKLVQEGNIDFRLPCEFNTGYQRSSCNPKSASAKHPEARATYVANF